MQIVKRKNVNVKEIWNKASEIDLLGYLGHKKGLNELELRKLSDIILSKLGNEEGLLLDVGCGICLYDVYLSYHFNEIIAIDISPKIARKALKRIKSFDVKNISLIIGDARLLPLRDKVVDVCISMGVIKHIPEQPYSTLKVIKEINRVVKGRVYINDLPNLLSVDGILYKLAIFIWTKIFRKFTTYTYFYTPSHLDSIFRMAGCKRITWYGCGWHFPLSAFLMLLPPFKHIANKLYIKPLLTTLRSDRPLTRYSSIEVLYRV